MLDAVVRRLIEYGYERALRQELLAASVRLGPDQMPDVYTSHRAALARLDLDEDHDLYLTQFPITNAAAIGSGKPVVLVNSRTVELLDDMELRTVLGHEAGHILSDHVLYRTALIILLSISGIGRMPLMMGLPLIGVRMALLEWFRAAELSCDRAATLVNRDPLVTCRTLMVIAGGAASRRLNLDAFIRQAGEYRDQEWGYDRIARLRLELAPAAPIPSSACTRSWTGCAAASTTGSSTARTCAAARAARARRRGRRGRLLRRALQALLQGRRRRGGLRGRQVRRRCVEGERLAAHEQGPGVGSGLGTAAIEDGRPMAGGCARKTPHRGCCERPGWLVVTPVLTRWGAAVSSGRAGYVVGL